MRRVCLYALQRQQSLESRPPSTAVRYRYGTLYLGVRGSGSRFIISLACEAAPRTNDKNGARPEEPPLRPGAVLGRRRNPRETLGAAPAAAAAKAPPTTSAAPQEGEDRAFDAKVAALARRKEIIREECWAAFGGQGAPAEVGAIPDFDASVDAAFAAVRRADKRKQEEDFERAVQKEMASLMSDVKAEVRQQQRESKASPVRREAKESVADIFGGAEPRFPPNRRREAKDDAAEAKLVLTSRRRFRHQQRGGASSVDRPVAAAARWGHHG